MGPGGVIFGNHFTDHAVVQVACDQTTCVTLFNPSAHRCGIIFDVALRVMQGHPEGGPPADVVGRAREAIAEVLRFLPPPTRPLEVGHMEELFGVLEKGPAKEGSRRKKNDPLSDV